MLLTQPEKYTTSYRTIKNNHLFLVDDPNGLIPADNTSGLGLYHLDTRFLSCLEIRLVDTSPVCLLSSTEQGYQSTLVYTNGQLETVNLEGHSCTVAEESIQLKRESILDGALFEKCTLTSYNVEPIRLKVSIRFCTDFRDIFEIRHLVPFKERHLNEPCYENNVLSLSYDSPAGRFETRIVFKDFTPTLVGNDTIVYETCLFQNEKSEFHFEVQTIREPSAHNNLKATGYLDALSRVNTFNQLWREEVTEFVTDNQDFNEMLERCHKDIRMLLSQTNEGDYFVAAGIPWYVCLFGRDSIITARQCLIFNPSIAKWTLHILARYQGTRYDPDRDEEPGKILHELRTGELATIGEIPHTPYYGSVDATPLWLILLHDYYQWTKDFETLEDLWPNALQAMAWIDHKLAENEHGYLTYFTQTKGSLGIVHQGWKDSHNSAMYENGIQAEPPIALSEVQGYVYLAKHCMSKLADTIGDKGLKHQLRREYQDLKYRFNRDFWMDDKRYIALGLDSQGNPLRVISSNPGHCLETGILTHSHAGHVASRLMKPDMFNGWGIRTLSSEMVAYNPMSYHNGTIWPHDNAMIAKGMSEIGHTEYVEKIFSGLFEAARLTTYKRLPELFCGFSRDVAKNDPPVRYPVACSPQAWAAGAVFSLIQSMVKISPDLQNGVLNIVHPDLPSGLNFLQIKNMRVGQVTINLEFKRTEKTVVVDILGRQGKLDILIKK